jgi:hypothetical protein
MVVLKILAFSVIVIAFLVGLLLGMIGGPNYRDR